MLKNGDFARQVQHFFPFSKPRRKGRFHWRRGQRPGEGTRQYMVLGTVASGLVASCTRKTNGARPCGRRKTSFFLVTVTKKKFDRRLKKSCTFSKKIEHFSKFCQNGIWARDHRHFEMVSKSSPFLYDLKGGDAAEKRGGTRRKKTGDKNFDANHTSRAGPGPQKQLMYEKKQ